jgi:acyl-CoA thioesterase
MADDYQPTTQDKQRVAEGVRESMFAEDAAAQMLGMEVESIGPGRARVGMTVRPDMLNGFGICHGGLITTLADTAFAYACNSHNELTLAAGIVMDLLAPVHEGERLTADAHEVAVKGRNGIYDVVVTNQDRKVVAVMRGRSFTKKGETVITP